MSKLIPFTLFISFLISTTNLDGQAVFQEGYIIKNSGDTINGFIRFETELEAQKECVFRNDNSSQPQIFSPADLTTYSITNRSTHVAKRIQVNSVSSQVVFVKKVVNGKISLFQYFEKNDFKLFVEKVGSEDFIELREEKRSYKGVLNFLTNECDQVKEDVTELPYNIKKIRELITVYNKCVDPDFVSEFESIDLRKNGENLGPKKSSFGVEIGLGSENLTIETSDIQFDYFNDSDLENGFLPRVGLFYKSHLRATENHLAFGIGVSYAIRQFKSDSERLLPPDEIERNSILLQLNSLAVPIFLEYSFLNDQIRPFAKIGMEYRNLSVDTNSRIIESEIGNEVFISENSVFELSSNELGFNIGAGAEYILNDSKALGVEVRYTIGTGIDSGGISDTSQIQLLISLSSFKVK